MNGYDFDLLIIGGGGSAGFTAATTALKQGAKVGMVESGRLGGLCILAGCMPSKTLLHSAEKVMAGGRGREAYPAILDAKKSIVEHLAGLRVQAVERKKADGLKVLFGAARFVDEHTVEVDGENVTAKAFVVATGSKEVIPPIPGLTEAGPLTSDSFLDLTELPESLVVLGGGVLALEMAQFAARMGVKTSVIQRSRTLMSGEEPLVGGLMAEVLEAEGAEVFTEARVLEVESKGPHKTVIFEREGQRKSVRADQILAALGRKPRSGDLNLESVGVQPENGAVMVDRFMRTSRSHIFAAGDVTGQRKVVNLAVLQGEVAGYNAVSSEQRPIDDSILPWAVFFEPQFARVGLNRAEAEKAGINVLEASYRLDDLGVSRTYPGGLKGFMSMRAAREDGRILGAEILSPEASLMIHQVALVMKLGGRPSDIAGLAYIHPCLAELVNLCAMRLDRALEKAAKA